VGFDVAAELTPDPAPPTPAAPAPLARRLRHLALAFGKVGVFGFGGGPAFIPLIEREVLRRGWLTREAFLDAFAFGNALPGPITTKLAGFVGYRVAGWPGATIALLALTLPTILAMVALAALFVRAHELTLLERFLAGLRPVVIALLVLVVLGFAPAALRGVDRFERGWRWALALAAFALAALADVHPALLIVAGGLVGLVAARRT
jgi:chromate transporter